MRRIAVILVLLLASSFVSASYASVSKIEHVSFFEISPADSSMWISAPGRGLVRVGRNQKAFTYSSLKGDFPCDSIVSLCFDNEGTLWVRDAHEGVFSYTSLTGFVLRNDVPENLRAVLSSTPLIQSGEIVSEAQYPAGNKSVSEPSHRSFAWVWILLSLLLSGACFVVLRKRFSTPSETPLTAAESGAVFESEPAPRPVQPVNVSKPEVKKPKPALPVSAAVPVDSDEFYNKVVSIIDSNFVNPDFSVEDIAAELGISRVHLNRKLRASRDVSPIALIKSARMNKAAELIRKGEKQIADIAVECGFSSATYFSTAFKDYFNVSPKDFLSGNED